MPTIVPTRTNAIIICLRNPIKHLKKKQNKGKAPCSQKSIKHRIAKAKTTMGSDLLDKKCD